MNKLQVYDLPTRILAALSERRHRIRDGSQNDPWVPYRHVGVLYVVHALTLLYLLSAKLAPSPAPARVSDGVVRDV